MPKTKKTQITKGKTKKKKTARSPKKKTAARARKLQKTHLSASELNHYKKLILAQKNEILENQRKLREALVDESTGEYVGENSTFSMHMAEQGTDEMEREKAYMLIQRDEKHLFYLDNALDRIERKSYGLCISCGKPIEKGRLEAVPITQHCYKCKTTLSNSE
jgi:DnaK suppressor protein